MSWHKERLRHSLAARGIPTSRSKKYFATKSPSAQAGITDFTGLGKDDSTEQSKELLKTIGGSRTTQPSTVTQRLRGARGLEEESVDFIRSRRPVEKALESAQAGNVGEVLTLLAKGKDEAGLKITSDQADALQSSLNVHAISLASAGAPVPDGIKERLDPAIVRRINLIEKEQARELESPFKTVLREKAVDAAVAAVDLPGAILSTTAKGIGAGAEEFNNASSDVKSFPGVHQKIEELGNTPIITKNSSIAGGGDVEIPRLSDRFNFVDDGREATNPVFKKVDKTKSFSEDVQGKVDSLHTNRREFARTDTSAFEEGDKAFKEGNRETLIGSIAELQSQEAVLKDKWNFVSQTHAQMMSNQNHESAYKETTSNLGVIFGSQGSRQLADQATKLNDVRGELVKSNNRVSGRRKMLENRLQRLDSEVPPETSVPKKNVKVFGGEDTMAFLGVDNPVIQNE